MDDGIERIQVVVRLDKELVKRIDHWGIDHDMYRSQAIEDLVARGLTVYRPSKAQGE